MRGGIQDRTLLEDAVYTRTLQDEGIFEERDSDVYFELFEAMSRAMARPDLLVFLDVAPEVAKERVVQRKRGRQVDVSLDFLSSVHRNYERLLRIVSRSIPVVRVPYDEFWDPDLLVDALAEHYARADFLSELAVRAEESGREVVRKAG